MHCDILSVYISKPITDTAVGEVSF